ncbi:MAG: hypothetical protein LM564_00235 [Desulfurococcaceae archaeon]|nr:hypothetical protein [Desulfurococcaceae archaeon]
MPKVTKKEPKGVRRGRLKVAEGLEVNIEYDGREYRAIYGGKVVSKVSGSFIEWCFDVDVYNICVTKDELEGVLHVG